MEQIQKEPYDANDKTVATYGLDFLAADDNSIEVRTHGGILLRAGVPRASAARGAPTTSRARYTSRPDAAMGARPPGLDR